MQCAKFHCEEPATHVLVISSDLMDRIEARARCESCGRADRRSRLVERVMPDCATALVPMPQRRQARVPGRRAVSA